MRYQRPRCRRSGWLGSRRVWATAHTAARGVADTIAVKRVALAVACTAECERLPMAILMPQVWPSGQSYIERNI